MSVVWKGRALEIINDTMLGLEPSRQWILRVQLEHIEDELRHVPHRLGESRSGNCRIWFLGVLELYFDVETNGDVTVLLAEFNHDLWSDFEAPNDPL